MNRIWVWCTFEFEGFHRWAGAPDSVEYLRTKHRHLFKCKVWVEVRHEDREIEFITLKHDCQKALGVLDIERVGSCEVVAGTILMELKKIYPKRMMMAEVSEDGECGARVELDDRE
jgi:hypothetical protein